MHTILNKLNDKKTFAQLKNNKALKLSVRVQ